ncbi:MAG: DUF2807 domain-containing protein [Fimbriimonadaceae bacterium]|nr:DUF2807 domain-containing protein [Fimbriimonadaceae bacterium]
MKNAWLFLSLGVAALLVGCSSVIAQVRGSGKVKSETRKTADFRRIEVAGACDLDVVAGKTLSVQVVADDNILPLVKTVVEHGRLVIKTEGSYTTHRGVKAIVTVPHLDGLSITGSGSAVVKGIASPTFSVVISGSGDAKVEGRADAFDASIVGSGSVHGYGLVAKKGRASISGSGDVEVRAESTLDVSIAGSGSVRYKGSPKLTKAIAGSGDVTHG